MPEFYSYSEHLHTCVVHKEISLEVFSQNKVHTWRVEERKVYVIKLLMGEWEFSFILCTLVPYYLVSKMRSFYE